MKLILVIIIYLLMGSDVSTPVSYIEILSIVRDIIAIIGIALGLYFGKEGLKKYLINNAIKTKIKDLHRQNKKVFDVTKKIINKVNNKENISRPVEDNDITEIKSLTRKLVKHANGASTEVHTLAFLLNATISNIKPVFKNEYQSEQRWASDFYYLLYSTCNKINHFASNIVDIPEETKLEKYNDININLRKYFNKQGFKKVKGFQFGLDTNPHSAISVIFSNIISKSTSDYIFKKKFYQIIRSNDPIVYELYNSEIYFPVIIESNVDTPLLGKSPLHLVNYKIVKSFPGDQENIYFTYSNLNQAFSFIDSLSLDSFFSNYKDIFLPSKNVFKDYTDEIIKQGEESIRIKCKHTNATKYFESVKKDLENKLDLFKKNS